MSLLHTPEGGRALAAALAEADPDSLGAATRLRKDFPPELAAEALSQARLRRKARTKFGERAQDLWFTADALEQATRPVVSGWRAERLVAAGVRRVVDLGCGIGADALAFLEAGLEVVAVELDETTADHARANLPGARVITGDAVALASDLLQGAGPETCVFIDPARRTEFGRTWQVEAFTPPWKFVLGLLGGPHSTVVKLGPGVPKNLIPGHVEALWVADGHDVVEASLWKVPGARPGHGAVLASDGLRVDLDPHCGALPVANLDEIGPFLLEPHGAAIRAGIVPQLVPDGMLLAEGIAYVVTDEPVGSPWVTCFAIDEVLDLNPKVLKAWVREHRIGTLEIKKRGVDLDPAELRKKLRPSGPGQATLVLTPTSDGARALVVQRV